MAPHVGPGPPRWVRLMMWGILIVALLVAITGLIYIKSLEKFMTTLAVERTNPLHMIYLGLAYQILAFPVPFPGLMLSLCILGGYYFRWHVLIIISIAFCIHIPINFFMGVLFQHKLGPIEVWGRAYFSCCLSRYIRYATALRHAFEQRPFYLSALWMWSPLPAQFEPFLLGASTRVPYRVLGVLIPCKIFQGWLMSSVGMQAETLEEALESGSSTPGQLALLIIGIVFTITLMLVLARQLTRQLRHMAEQEERDMELHVTPEDEQASPREETVINVKSRHTANGFSRDSTMDLKGTLRLPRSRNCSSLQIDPKKMKEESLSAGSYNTDREPRNRSRDYLDTPVQKQHSSNGLQSAEEVSESKAGATI
ncbi:hypothetical protein AAMO2058_001020200 [Amorphochlora amoebiformis]